MKLSFLKDLNLLKLSGKNEIIIADVLPQRVNITLVSRKKTFNKFRHGDVHSSINIIKQIEVPAEHEFISLKKEIKDIIDAYGLREPLIIAGICEFKHFSVQVPPDTEDVEAWFMENSAKFLPQGRPKDEFTYSYEIYKKDDNFSYYNVIIVRSDYLNRLIAALNTEQGKLIAIFPFAVALIHNQFTHDKNILYLNLLTDRIIYSFINDERQFIYGEYYNEIIGNDSLQIQMLNSTLTGIKEIINPLLKENPEADYSIRKLEIVLNTEKTHYQGAEHVLKGVFSPLQINEDLKTFNPDLAGALLGLNLIFNDVDTGLNLIKDHFENNVRFSIEKMLAMRTVILAGFILMSALLIFFISETYLAGRLQEIDEGESANVSKTLQAEQLQTENQRLRVNLNQIRSLKGGKEKYTSLLFNVTKVVTDKSRITDLKLKDAGNSAISCEISGLAFSQEEVSKIIEKMEMNGSFKDVQLQFSGYNENQENIGEKGKMIDFKISAGYNAN